MQVHLKDDLDWKEYRPIGFIFQSLGYLTKTTTRKWLFSLTFLAEWTGLEPATPGVTGRYSNQLNYHSSFFFESLAARLRSPDRLEKVASPRGFEPL
jgi:hypothetical protein